MTGKGGGERAQREGGRGEGKTFLRSPTLQMGAQFTNAYEQGETQGFFARALKPFEVALHPPSLGGGRALRPVPSTDSGDDERGWHGGGGGGLRGKNLFFPSQQAELGPHRRARFMKGPVPHPIERGQPSREGKDDQETSFDSKPLLSSSPLGEGIVRPALTKGDACIWCSYENQNPLQRTSFERRGRPPLFDKVSTLFGEGGLAARREGRSRKGRRI